MRTSIATVSLSGTLEEKIAACAAAGFDGVEVMDADVVSSRRTPRAIGDFIRSFGLSVELFQPIRDVEGVDAETFGRNSGRFARKVDVAAELGAPGVLLCSNVGTATVSADEPVAEQLHALGEIASRSGLFVAYEALAWGRFVNHYEHAWHLAELADHPAVGTCLDSFHILSVGDSLDAIGELPADRLLFCQVADARGLALDPLTRSRHHRLFPGQGVFDLASFVQAVEATGYDGPYSLEIFNDVFRQVDARATAVDARRSLRYLERLASVPPANLAQPSRVHSVAITSSFPPLVESLLGLTGFTRTERSAAGGTAWLQGDAEIIVAPALVGDQELPAVGGVTFRVDDASAAARAADELLAGGSHGSAPTTLRAPDQTRVQFAALDQRPVKRADASDVPPIGVTAIDHVSLTQPWDRFDESVLFYRAVAGLEPRSPVDVPDPRGLILSQALETRDGSVRLVLTVDPSGWGPGSSAVPATHVGLQVRDIFAASQLLTARGVGLVEMPDNYYQDLAARFALAQADIERLRGLRILYDEDGVGGRYWQLYTHAYGDFFFELVQREGGYSGYGESNAPVRRAAQQAG